MGFYWLDVQYQFSRYRLAKGIRAGSLRFTPPALSSIRLIQLQPEGTPDDASGTR